MYVGVIDRKGVEMRPPRSLNIRYCIMCRSELWKGLRVYLQREDGILAFSSKHTYFLIRRGCFILPLCIHSNFFLAMAWRTICIYPNNEHVRVLLIERGQICEYNLRETPIHISSHLQLYFYERNAKKRVLKFRSSHTAAPTFYI
jgi:hypothetical protein